MKVQVRMGAESDQLAVELFGKRAVKVNVLYARMGAVKSRKIVYHHRGGIDIRVKTRGAGTGFQNIPHGDPGVEQDLDPRFIIELGFCTVERAHDGPKRITGMGIILMRQQRLFSWHATQNQHPGVRVRNRRKTPKSGKLRCGERLAGHTGKTMPRHPERVNVFVRRGFQFAIFRSWLSRYDCLN